MSDLSVVFLDLAQQKPEQQWQEALTGSNLRVSFHTQWQSATSSCAGQRPDIAVVNAARADQFLVDVCTAIRRSNAQGEVYTVLLAPDDVITNELIISLGLVCVFAQQNDLQITAHQIQLAALSGRRVQVLEQAWLENESALNTLNAASCIVDAESESCAIPTSLRMLLRLSTKPDNRERQRVAHWRDLLVALDELGAARGEAAIKRALTSGETFSYRCSIASDPTTLLVCHGRCTRREDGSVAQLTLTWQKLLQEDAGSIHAPVVPLYAPTSSQTVFDRIERHISGTLLFFRIDNFSELCRSLGFITGQQVLAMLGKCVSEELRSDDIVVPRDGNNDQQVAQVGGAEVIAVLDGLVEADAVRRVQGRVITKLNQDFEVQGRRIPLKVSTGRASWPRDGKDIDDLLVNAALSADYATPNNGWPEEPDGIDLKAARDNVRMEADLYDAVLNRELQLHYQPKYSLLDGQLSGVEALLRWHRGHAQWVPPDVFIPIAERTGLITSIGRWVIEEAVQAHARWFEMGLGRVPVAINISPEQLCLYDFAEMLTQICTTHNVPRTNIELEITESCLIGDAQQAISTLEHLRAEGFSIALDDFGTGFSSLSYLRSLPLDVLKIDRSFISSLSTDEDYDPGLIACIVGLGLTLGLRIVAEGIEREEQWHLLSDWGCHDGQGFLMSKPLAEELVLPLLEAACWSGVSQQSA